MRISTDKRKVIITGETVTITDERDQPEQLPWEQFLANCHRVVSTLAGLVFLLNLPF